MIHRQNWLDIRAYLHHMDRVRQNSPETVKRSRAYMRHLIEWANETPLPKARAIDPIFPAYLANKNLAPASITKGLSAVRQYFEFARAEWPTRYKRISESWISMLQPPRHLRLESRLPIRQFYSLDDVLKIASVSTETLRQERGKVAVCMLFLSGMRAEALASLPISCMHLAEHKIEQLPERGVRTKNRKAAITYLLPIQPLLDVCLQWDRRVRALSPESLWYATLTRDGMNITGTCKAFTGRHNAIERDVRLICEWAEVPYLSPHKLRHGHVVHALKNARDLADLKAISQNVMHASVTITDQVYGGLLDNDVRDIIGRLGDSPAATDKIDEILSMLKQIQNKTS
jgi:site-specific recombinase XerD